MIFAQLLAKARSNQAEYCKNDAAVHRASQSRALACRSVETSLSSCGAADLAKEVPMLRAILAAGNAAADRCLCACADWAAYALKNTARLCCMRAAAAIPGSHASSSSCTSTCAGELPVMKDPLKFKGAGTKGAAPKLPFLAAPKHTAATSHKEAWPSYVAV